MKKTILMVALLLSACGYESRDGELIGQAKKVSHNTPLLCPDWNAVDISLGVMQGGVGSMSTQDVWLVVSRRSDYLVLQQAVEKGAIVKVHYDVARLVICATDHILTGVEVVQPQ